ncbi:uncharacterized protein LOC108679189 [Hyalella azteca]|uniref:Uncharacterized protein LOC108679189 n=1 Tax=Hyalella azteca TaxID=294128 RepID=A0A979FW57_HYAAZ|nr:uncharacterized protein LOC108679189 [Hyalella azteca]
MDDLLPSSVYDFSSWCCNHVGCSLRTNASEATEFEAPVVRDRLQVVSIYDTIAILRLPTVEAGDAQTNFTIMVHNISAGLEEVNFTAEFHKWRRANHMQIHRRRRSSRPGCAENAPVFIAGHVAKGTSLFVLGSGESAPGTSNCPLIKSNAYGVAVMMSARLKHEEEFVLEKLDRLIIAGGNSVMAASATVGMILGLVILVLVVGLLVSSFQWRKKLRRLQVPVRPPVPDTLPLQPLPPARHPRQDQNAQQRDAQQQGAANCRESAVYDDVYDFRAGWVPADDLPVSMANIETFLNKSIGSLYMKHKFSSIPVNRDKPTRVAALAGNLKKNRYGNNLPYDDTRVHLLEIDDYAAYIDPHSDYINASHITVSFSQHSTPLYSYQHFIHLIHSSNNYISSCGAKTTLRATTEEVVGEQACAVQTRAQRKEENSPTKLPMPTKLHMRVSVNGKRLPPSPTLNDSPSLDRNLFPRTVNLPPPDRKAPPPTVNEVTSLAP